MREPYERCDALLYDSYARGVDGDVAFFVEEAKRAGGDVCEIGAGTGRILVPIAEAGVRVVGIDRSARMLEKAREKLRGLSPEVRERIDLVEADMRRFSLGRTFRLILVPFRAFQHMLTVEDQRQALARMWEHLDPDGRLIVDVFDPKLEYITAALDPERPARVLEQEFTHPASGRPVQLWTVRHFDPAAQVLHQTNVFEEMGADGKVVSRLESPLTLRWGYRFEMEHLFRLSGFEVEDLFGDFTRGPFRYGGEQIWVVRKAAT